MIQHTFIGHGVGDVIEFKSSDGYAVRGKVAHVRYALGVRSERMMYYITRCEGHPRYVEFWLSVRDGKEAAYGAR